MNQFEREINNEDGSIDTLSISSKDNYTLNMPKTYILANHIQRKENKLVSAYKNSILGAEIGVKAEGFSNITILATIIAIGAFCTMYLFFRV